MNYAHGKGLTPLIIFRNGAERTTELTYAPHDHPSFKPEDDIYDFIDEPKNCKIHDYLNRNGELIHSPDVQEEIFAPDVTAFCNAILWAESIDNQTKDIFVSGHSLLQANSGDDTNMKACLAFLIEKVKNHASKNKLYELAKAAHIPT